MPVEPESDPAETPVVTLADLKAQLDRIEARQIAASKETVNEQKAENKDEG